MKTILPSINDINDVAAEQQISATEAFDLARLKTIRKFHRKGGDDRTTLSNLMDLLEVVLMKKN